MLRGIVVNKNFEFAQAHSQGLRFDGAQHIFRVARFVFIICLKQFFSGWREIKNIWGALHPNAPPPVASGLGLLQAFEEWANRAMLSSFCDDVNLHISVFTYPVSVSSLHTREGFMRALFTRDHIFSTLHTFYLRSRFQSTSVKPSELIYVLIKTYSSRVNCNFTGRSLRDWSRGPTAVCRAPAHAPRRRGSDRIESFRHQGHCNSDWRATNQNARGRARRSSHGCRRGIDQSGVCICLRPAWRQMQRELDVAG